MNEWVFFVEWLLCSGLKSKAGYMTWLEIRGITVCSTWSVQRTIGGEFGSWRWKHSASLLTRPALTLVFVYNRNTVEMVVRIRLARFGRRNLPFYHIVVANARTARNSKPIEKIGTYNPIPDETGNKMVNLNFDRAKYWLTVGAQPSETVEKLLVKVNKNPFYCVRKQSILTVFMSL